MMPLTSQSAQSVTQYTPFSCLGVSAHLSFITSLIDDPREEGTQEGPFPLLYLRYYEEDDNDGGILRQT